jgi:asparagine synthase (glutamine-hydrolysing)
MCSIAGIVRISNFDSRSSNGKNLAQVSDSNTPITLHSAVESMIAVLAHRGPDDRGIADFEFKNTDLNAAGRNPQSRIQVSLGNTRLAIIDLSAAGHQPMHDEDAGLTITYNGEVYNFRELRAELGNEFGDWRSDSDTEVVLRAYRKWRIGAFERLRGMFALAIWDHKRRQLVLARDQFGIKPLYYYAKVQSPKSKVQSFSNEERGSTLDFGSFIFASEVRALLASGAVPRKLDREGLASYLQYGSVRAPLTIINDVRSLMPGNYLRIHEVDGVLKTDAGSYLSSPKSNVQRPMSESRCSEFLWEPSPKMKTLDFGLWTLDREIPRSRPDAVALLREKLKESVRAHLVSDVPLGIFLSGGMDSSALVALMANIVSEPPKTFSVVFDEQKFSEASHSRRIAERFKTDHIEVLLTEERLLQMLPEALASLDQPTMDGINTYVVSGAVKEAGITVALSGLGGDELFAGYPTFRRALRMKSFSSLSKRLLNSALGIVNKAPGASVQQKKFWQLAASDGTPEAVYAVTRQLFAPDSIQCLLKNFYDQSATTTEVPHKTKSAIRNSKFEILKDPVNAISRLELQGYMADTLLRDTDCMSMAHSLEVRVPFLDVKLVPYVLSLPGRWKKNGATGSRPKPLLADALGDLLPKDLLQRPKMGFTLPFERWMQSRLREEISRVLEDNGSISRAGVNAYEASSIWQRFLQAPGSVGWSRPWALYVLAKWCDINDVSADYADYADYTESR